MDDQSDSSVTGQARLMDNRWGKTREARSRVSRTAAEWGAQASSCLRGIGHSRRLCPPMAELTPT